MSVVDASVWASAFIFTDAFHAASVQWFADELRLESAVYIPTLAFVEVSAAVARRTGSVARARRAVTTMRSTPGLSTVDLDEDLAHIASEMAALSGLRGADAVYIALAHMLGLPLATWDREQAVRGSRFIAAQFPNGSTL